MLKRPEKRPENVKPDQKKQILDLVLEHPSISRLELAKLLGLHDSMKKKVFRESCCRRIIKRVGSNKGGYWEVTKPIS